MRRTTVLVVLALFNAAAATGQSAQDTLDIEVAAVRAIAGTNSSPGDRPRYLLNSAIMQREAAPGYKVGERAVDRSRRLSEALGVPFVDRDKAIVCQNRSCEIQNASALVSLSEVRFDRDRGSVTLTIDRQGPDRIVNGERRRRMYYETLHYEFVREASGWKLTGATQLGIS